MTEFETKIDESAIAIIGMSGRFPGANDIEAFWQNLENGIESLHRLSDEELQAAGVSSKLRNHPDYVKANYPLTDADCFDADFFGYSPREAKLMDPQQRVFLECAWSALEHAGYNPDTYAGAIGIYGGAGMNHYLLNQLAPNFTLNSSEPSTFAEISAGNGSDFLTTRVSYKLNLKGPSLDVQTACSTSLVAIDLACESLLEGKCKIALAGGVSLTSLNKTGYLYQPGLVLSPDGHCRPFDAKGEGMLGSNGVGIVVLKSLEDALADGDTIHAIIKGSAVNNDGSDKIGFTAPSLEGQASAIAEAQEMAEVDPDTISYVEAHGTATPLGDPIEIAALTKAFESKTDKKRFCAVGSLKSNIGHLDAAAGVASLIKTVLALKHKRIPASLNFEYPNPQIDFENSPFYVNTQLNEWHPQSTPRRAGVSSFGIGGTNAHVILEEWEQTKPRGCSEQKPHTLILLSAKTPTALDKATENLNHYLQQHPKTNLRDLAYTLSVGRKAFDYRRIAVVSKQNPEAPTSFTQLDANSVLTNTGHVAPRSVVFMFSGQDAQHINMARSLYESEANFKSYVDQCCSLLQPLLGVDLLEIIYPAQGQSEKSAAQLKQTSITQPALFTIEYAYAQLWMTWGIQPAALIGHSIGEYVAATVSGILSLEDALTLVVARGALMQSMPPGLMLAVPLAEKEVNALLEGTGVELATINSPTNCVVSGESDDIKQLQDRLSEQGIEGRRLHTSHAFHSHMMDPILEAFTEKVKGVKLNPPRIPIISNITGTWLSDEDATNPNYYAQHLRHCVRFADGVKQFFKHPEQVILEVGPGRTLSTLVKRHPDKPSTQIVLASARHPQESTSDTHVLLKTLGQLWLAGTAIDWNRFYGEQTHYRIPLPTYPFERKRFWIDNARPIQLNSQNEEKNPSVVDWLYQPSWKRLNLSNANPQDLQGPILIFLDEFGIGEALNTQLKLKTDHVVCVRIGQTFNANVDNQYEINPNHREDYDDLMGALVQNGQTPKLILHLWNITPSQKLSIEAVRQAQHLGFYSLLWLTQALSKKNCTDTSNLIVVSNHLYEVTGEESIAPEKSTVLGCLKVIEQETPHLRCRSIDVALESSLAQPHRPLVETLLKEVQSSAHEPNIAYRHRHRWVQTYEPCLQENTDPVPSRLKHGGVYLITGGLGGIGFVLAEHLAKTTQAKLILTGRSALPERSHWAQWLNEHEQDETTSQKIQKVKTLEALGAEVLIQSADVANHADMQKAIELAEKQFGPVNGVIHTAGLPSGGIIENRTKEDIETTFSAKVIGTVNLNNIFSDTTLDFFICCSSLASILGGVGRIDYSAANSFLDAFAHYKQATDNTFTLSINWDGWQGVGMALETANLLGGAASESALLQKTLAKSILPDEGVKVFQHILQWPLPQVLVSTWDLALRTKKYLGSSRLNDEKNEQQDLQHAQHQRPKLTNSYVAPRNNMEEKTAAIWQEFLGIDAIGIHDDFFELGGDSLLAIQLIPKLQSEFKIQLSPNALLSCSSVASLCTHIQGNLQSNTPASSSCLVELNKGNPKLPPLFLIHPVGGAVYFYRDLAKHLDAQLPVYGIQAKGIEEDVETLATIDEMANYYLKAIRQRQAQGPYLLGGASFGGVLAYEIAQRLNQSGERPPVIFMLDTPGPKQIPESDFQTNAEIILYYLTMLGGKNILELPELETLSREQQIAYFWEQQSESSNIAADQSQTLRMLHVFKANMLAMQSYKPEVYYGKLVFLRAKEWQGFAAKNPESAWLNLAAGGMDLHEVAGNHMTMNLAPHVQSSATIMQKYIDEAITSQHQPLAKTAVESAFI